METLLCKIRVDPDIKGLRIGSYTHVTAAFADDLLVMTSNPKEALPKLLNIFEDFGFISNFKINYGKSMALNISCPQAVVNALKRATPFTWASRDITYLGTHISANVQDLTSLNYIPLLKTVRSHLQNLKLPFVSWVGRKNYIKTFILPKFLYLLQALPIWLPNSYFTEIRRMFTRFLWNGKSPRIAYSVLTRDRRFWDARCEVLLHCCTAL